MSTSQKLLPKGEPCVYKGQQPLYFKLFNAYIKMLFPKQLSCPTARQLFHDELKIKTQIPKIQSTKNSHTNMCNEKVIFKLIYQYFLILYFKWLIPN